MIRYLRNHQMALPFQCTVGHRLRLFAWFPFVANANAILKEPCWWEHRDDDWLTGTIQNFNIRHLGGFA